MKTASLLAVPLLLGTTALAQSQLVRGDVDSISGTNRFQLECTQIPLVSTAVNLQQLNNLSSGQDIEFEMRVNNIGTPSQPVLDVLSAVQIPEIFDMGNLRFGRSESWEVLGAPGSLTAVYLGLRATTFYQPFGPFGTWVMGPEALPLRTGVIGGGGRFQFQFTMPTFPQLVGVEFTAQALVAEPTRLLITNPDCKEVRDN